MPNLKMSSTFVNYCFNRIAIVVSTFKYVTLFIYFKVSWVRRKGDEAPMELLTTGTQLYTADNRSLLSFRHRISEI